MQHSHLLNDNYHSREILPENQLNTQRTAMLVNQKVPMLFHDNA